MDIKKVEILTTLKANKIIYTKGQILEAPFDKGITDEIRAKTNTIRVLERVSPPIQKEIPAPPSRRGRPKKEE